MEKKFGRGYFLLWFSWARHKPFSFQPKFISFSFLKRNVGWKEGLWASWGKMVMDVWPKVRERPSDSTFILESHACLSPPLDVHSFSASLVRSCNVCLRQGKTRRRWNKRHKPFHRESFYVTGTPSSCFLAIIFVWCFLPSRQDYVGLVVGRKENTPPNKRMASPKEMMAWSLLPSIFFTKRSSDQGRPSNFPLAQAMVNHSWLQTVLC